MTTASATIAPMWETKSVLVSERSAMASTMRPVSHGGNMTNKAMVANVAIATT